jgi:tetratricopeptide (TPR) repeat protein
MAVAQGEEDKSEASARSSAAARLSAQRAAKAAAKAKKRGTAPIMPGKLTRGVGIARGWYEQNQRTLWSALGGGLLAAVAWLAASQHFDKRGREAAELLGAGVAAANAPIMAPGEEPPAGQTAPEESYPNAQARAEKARREFRALIKRFPDAPATAWAKLGEANVASELGKPAEAQRLYERLVANNSLDSFVRWRALEGLGFSLEAQQKYADAAQRFEQIGALQNGAFKTVADYHRSRMLIALGQQQKAADVLQALVKAERARPPGEGMRFDGIVTDAETLLTELSVALNAPKLRADVPGPSAESTVGPEHSQGGTGLTQEIVDSLRKQLESGKGGKGLTKDIVEQLEKQVQSGDTGATKVVHMPAPKTESKPK